MKPPLLFYLFLLISFSSLAQQKEYKPFEHPVIQKLEKKSEDVIGFENKQKKSWLIAAVVVKKTKNIFLVNYIGDVINQLPLSDSAYEKILNKTLDPFEYHLISIESALELTDAAIAKLRFPELHLHYAGIDNFEEEVNQLLLQNALKEENNTADKITLLLELRQHYLQILVQSLAMQPAGLKEDTAFVNNLKSNLSGKVITRGHPDTATTAVFYNSDIFSPFHKAVFDFKNAKLFFYSGNENVIDSLSLNPKKSKHIADKNLDVFAIYNEYNLHKLLQADSIYREFSSYLLSDQRKKNSIIPTLLTLNEEEPAKLWYALQQNMHLYLGRLQLYYSADIHRFEQYQKYKIRTANYIKTAVYSEINNWLITGTYVTYYRGNKHYELTDHRGNVMVVISDKKIPVDANEDGTIDYYAADIIKATDYAPFGMGLVDRSFNAESYRYGYNGKENDEETGFQDYGFRIYNPGLGRFLSVDPLKKNYPWYTPYQFAGNSPIQAVDLDGKEPMRPKLLTNDLKWYQPVLKTWNYMALLPSDRAEGGYELQSMGSSKAVVWDYEYILWTGSRTYQHTEEITWVMYNGIFYNANGLYIISPSTLEGKETWEEYWGRQQMSQNSLNKASERAATAVAIGQLVSGFKNIYQGLKMMKAANASRASVDDKLARYLLNPNHPSGGSKAKWFKEALGFSIKNADDLAKQIIFDAKKAVSQGNTKGFGEMFEQMIDITGANGKKISVQFNFIIKEGEDFARLVGALPTKK